MYDFFEEEKSEWLKNLEEELHEDLKDLETFEGDRVYDSLKDLLTNGREKRDKSPTNLKNSDWLSGLKRGYMLEKENEYGIRNLLIPLEIFEDYTLHLKHCLRECIVDGVEISVDETVQYDDHLALKDGLEMLCIRGEVIRENIEKEEVGGELEALSFNEWLEADSKESDYDKRLIKEIETGWLEIQKTEADLIKVRSAWNDPGRAPGYHRKMQNKLRKEWPVLAAALDKL